MRKLFFVLILCFLSVCSALTFAGHLDETRYCLPIVRDANGVIVRSTAVQKAFQKIHPCPSTGLTFGPCPGWQRNHVIPLACGGCDAVSNMDWMPVEIKTCKDWFCRDRFERNIYGIYKETNCTAP